MLRPKWEPVHVREKWQRQKNQDIWVLSSIYTLTCCATLDKSDNFSMSHFSLLPNGKWWRFILLGQQHSYKAKMRFFYKYFVNWGAIPKYKAILANKAASLKTERISKKCN